MDAEAVAILRELVEDRRAGIGEEMGRCYYCDVDTYRGPDWEHAPDCAIRRGREWLARIDGEQGE